MNVPDDREYTESHEWIRMDGEFATIGITAQDPANSAAASEVILPGVGATLATGAPAAKLIIGGNTREIDAPLSGTVAAVNEELRASPQRVFEDPFGRGWIFQLRIEAGEEIEHLKEPGVYEGSAGRSIDPGL